MLSDDFIDRSLVAAIETKLLSTWLAKSSTNFSSVAADAGIVIRCRQLLYNDLVVMNRDEGNATAIQNNCSMLCQNPDRFKRSSLTTLGA